MVIGIRRAEALVVARNRIGDRSGALRAARMVQ